MAKAIWNGVVLAESDDIKIVEGNYYFPPQSVNKDYFSDSSHQTFCPWKGTAAYYDVSVEGETKANLAWYYPEPKPAAKEIKDHVAFYPSVTIEK